MKKNKTPDCIFCKIAAGEIPSYKIYEDRHVVAFLDIAKDFEGHTLVVPRKHFENVLDCPPNVLRHVMNAIKKISNHYVEKGYDGVNILNASGVAAEQSVFHLHFHIIPRKKADGFSTWPKVQSNPAMRIEDFHKNLTMLKK